MMTQTAPMLNRTRDPLILLLEDEPVVALDAVMSLRDHGFERVVHAASLGEAESEIAANTFDVAVLDININGTSSLPLARRLHEAGVPVIFASGYRPDDEALTGIADAFLVKPYNARQLVRHIRALGE